MLRILALPEPARLAVEMAVQLVAFTLVFAHAYYLPSETSFSLVTLLGLKQRVDNTRKICI